MFVGCFSLFRSLEQLSELLESPHLDVRMSAGEALAVIFELGRLENDEFEKHFAMDVTDTLKQLATDSHKYRAKKDRKQQRATFRDILQFIEVRLIDFYVKICSVLMKLFYFRMTHCLMYK